MSSDELELQPLEGLYHWLGPTLARFVLRLLSMEELPREEMTGLMNTQDGFFRRDRHKHPEIDAEGWLLRVGGVAQPRSFGLEELEAMPQHQAACVAECAGNGNHLMGSAGLMGQACWQGPLVADLIEACGGLGEATHLVFHGSDTIGPRGAYHYGLSWQEILDSGAILALRHCGDPLTRARGFPVRLVVPGIYAMSYVKWIARIDGLTERWRGFYNDVLYNNKRLVDGRWVKEQARWISLKSVLTRCQRCEGDWMLTGWAWGGGQAITRVEVTTDGGEHWHDAELATVHTVQDLSEPEAQHAWTEFRWRWQGPAPGPHLLSSRATNAAGQVQPEAEPPDVRGHYDQVRWKWRKVVVPAAP
jgi:DMSO/TMAO reductase YedYZ molybdopterin-dependent catalytic subunit